MLVGLQGPWEALLEQGEAQVQLEVQEAPGAWGCLPLTWGDRDREALPLLEASSKGACGHPLLVLALGAGLASLSGAQQDREGRVALQDRVECLPLKAALEDQEWEWVALLVLLEEEEEDLCPLPREWEWEWECLCPSLLLNQVLLHKEDRAGLLLALAQVAFLWEALALLVLAWVALWEQALAWALWEHLEWEGLAWEGLPEALGGSPLALATAATTATSLGTGWRSVR